MATLTVEDVVEGGLNPTYNAMAGAGDVCANTEGNVFLHIKNDSGATVAITVTAQGTSATKSGYGTLTKADATANIAASGAQMMGPFPRTAFNNTSGQIEFAASATTSVTVACLRLVAAT